MRVIDVEDACARFKKSSLGQKQQQKGHMTPSEYLVILSCPAHGFGHILASHHLLHTLPQLCGVNLPQPRLCFVDLQATNWLEHVPAWTATASSIIALRKPSRLKQETLTLQVPFLSTQVINSQCCMGHQASRDNCCDAEPTLLGG